ncbi:hypothetical protein BJ508DRAFT_414526 [Ascobolus immersus RN42]|uniref:L domain-like protein n=1 Tax=Ascobolus immersus RN42 TaxID=1160509 RepID=A0A3N4I6V8_ASCIM|nr:hypothetical protein BJ508DRAFT_414526 [Ascobolus immersus RN42]
MDPQLSINISRMDFVEWPDEVIYECSEGIQRIAAAHNRLTRVPSEFIRFSKLRYLSLRSNNLQAFPGILLSMGSLEILDLSRNNISKMPLANGQMCLKVLSVSYNQLTTLPPWLPAMNKLRVLKVDNNPLVLPRISDLSTAVDASGRIFDMKCFKELFTDCDTSNAPVDSRLESPSAKKNVMGRIRVSQGSGQFALYSLLDSLFNFMQLLRDFVAFAPQTLNFNGLGARLRSLFFLRAINDLILSRPCLEVLLRLLSDFFSNICKLLKSSLNLVPLTLDDSGLLFRSDCELLKCLASVRLTYCGFVDRFLRNGSVHTLIGNCWETPKRAERVLSGIETSLAKLRRSITCLSPEDHGIEKPDGVATALDGAVRQIVVLRFLLTNYANNGTLSTKTKSFKQELNRFFSILVVIAEYLAERRDTGGPMNYEMARIIRSAKILPTLL